ncbi:MAG: hypothetical protein LBV33_08020, partial [Lachnospiraceae bacterium]|nr:hypothetical protein [Lachnospiraceae bacterium]
MDIKTLQELVIKAQAGDAEALDRLCLDGLGVVTRIVHENITDKEVAQSLIGDIFQIVRAQIGTLRQPGAYYRWLNIIAGRECERVRAQLTAAIHRSEVAPTVVQPPVRSSIGQPLFNKKKMIMPLIIALSSLLAVAAVFIIVSGVRSGSTVTRGEWIEMLCEAKLGEEVFAEALLTENEYIFTDVPVTDPHYKAIQLAAGYGWLEKELETGLFEPATPATRGFVAQTAVHTQGYLYIDSEETFSDIEELDETDQYLLTMAVKAGIIEADRSDRIFPHQEATRKYADFAADFIRKQDLIMERPDDFENVAVLADAVIDLSAEFQNGEIVEDMENQFSFSEAVAERIEEGSIFFVSPTGEIWDGVAFKVTYIAPSISVGVNVGTVTPTIEEVFKELDVWISASSDDASSVDDEGGNTENADNPENTINPENVENTGSEDNVSYVGNTDDSVNKPNAMVESAIVPVNLGYMDSNDRVGHPMALMTHPSSGRSMAENSPLAAVALAQSLSRSNESTEPNGVMDEMDNYVDAAVSNAGNEAGVRFGENHALVRLLDGWTYEFRMGFINPSSDEEEKTFQIYYDFKATVEFDLSFETPDDGIDIVDDDVLDISSEEEEGESTIGGKVGGKVGGIVGEVVGGIASGGLGGTAGRIIGGDAGRKVGGFIDKLVGMLDAGASVSIPVTINFKGDADVLTRVRVESFMVISKDVIITPTLNVTRMNGGDRPELDGEVEGSISIGLNQELAFCGIELFSNNISYVVTAKTEATNYETGTCANMSIETNIEPSMEFFGGITDSTESLLRGAYHAAMAQESELVLDVMALQDALDATADALEITGGIKIPINKTERHWESDPGTQVLFSEGG